MMGSTYGLIQKANSSEVDPKQEEKTVSLFK